MSRAAARSMRRHRRQAFTLIELLVVIGIITILLSILIPTVARVREAGLRTQCASNLRQIGIGLHRYYNEFNSLPQRPPPLDEKNPHVLKFKDEPEDMSAVMLKHCGPKTIFYCPDADPAREPGHWWPYFTGTIAVTYQFPFWLHRDYWAIPKPDYKRLRSERLLAADFMATNDGFQTIIAANHLNRRGGPKGMNMLFGDGHVDWNDGRGGWVHYGWYYAFEYWHYAQY